MVSADTLNVSYQPHLPSARPPGLARRTPRLSNLTAIDSRSRRQRPGRQVTASAPAPPRPLSPNTFYNIRPMTSGDLPIVATLMKNEGWNVDFDNMAVVFHMQPEAYFVAHTMSGQVVGHCSALRLDASVGMLSYVLVSSQHQKQGLGTRLMDVAKLALGDRTMTFYSVENAVPFYKSRNFDTRRFSALVRDFSLDPKDFAGLPDGGQINVLKAQDVEFCRLNQYDSAVQGMDRAQYLRRWMLRRSNVAFAAVDSTSGDVVGYVSLSFFNGRWDVNPLYADSSNIAMQLLKRASREISESVRVFVRIPGDSSNAIKLFSKLRDITHHRVLYLMSDEALPHISSDKVYSLSTVCYGLK